MFPDGNRTRVFPLARAALSRLSYQFDNQSTAAQPLIDDGQEARWEPSHIGGWSGI